MIYCAVGLFVIGAAAGLAFRWKVLLPIIVLLPLVAVVAPISGGLGYWDIAIVVVVAEAVLQGGYFLGLLIRLVVTAGLRWVVASGAFKSRRDPADDGGDRHTSASAEAGKRS
jgi:hypothetical protein